MRHLRVVLLLLGAWLTAPVSASAQSAAPQFTDFTSSEAGTATGTLAGDAVTLTGTTVSSVAAGSVVDGSSTYFSAPAFLPQLAVSDFIQISSAGGASYTISFASAVEDPLLHVGTLASRLEFPAGTQITRLSGDAQFTVTGNRIDGQLGASSGQTSDSNGTVRLEGTFSSVTFSATPNFGGGGGDGVYVLPGVDPPADPFGLVARYHLDGSAADSSGNELDGGEVGRTDVPDGRFGAAFGFGAPASGFVVAPNGNAADTAPAELTLMAWVRAAGGGGPVLTRSAQPACGGDAFELLATDGGLTAAVRVSSGGGPAAYVSASTSVDVVDGQWHAVAATYDPDGGLVLHVDSERAATSPAAGQISYGAGGDGEALAVGRYAETECDAAVFAGAVDEVRMYDRALSDDELAHLQDPDADEPPALPVPVPDPDERPEPGLVLKWPLDAFDAATLLTRDISGNDLDGTVAGANFSGLGRFGGGVDVEPPTSGPNTLPSIGSAASAKLQTPRVTLLSWVRATRPVTFSTIAGRGGAICAYGLVATSSGVIFSARSSMAGVAETTPIADVWDGQWHAVAGVYDGERARLYVDGSQVGESREAPGTLDYANAVPGLQVGPASGRGCGGGRYEAEVDEVRVYDRALTAEEIAYLQAGFHRVPPRLPIPSGPKNLTRPALSGSPKIGATMTCTPGTWNGNPVSFTYVWERAPRSTTQDGDQAWNAINGATGQSYVLQANDNASRVRCREIATDAAGFTGEAVSTSKRVDPDVPINTIPPSISGSPKTPNVLTCDPGTWTNNPDFSYQWTRDGTVIAGATESTYRTVVRYDFEFALQDANGDGDRRLVCVVTGANDVGTSAPALSPDVLVVDGVPAPKAPPTVTLGPAADGSENPLQKTATCESPAYFFDYRDRGFTEAFSWYRNSVLIAGETGRQLKIVADHLGREISCGVLAANPAGAMTQPVQSPRVFIPLPVGRAAGQIESIYRNNRNDPVNFLATSDAYRQVTGDLTIALLREQADGLVRACRNAGYDGGGPVPTDREVFLLRRQLDVTNPEHFRPLCQIFTNDPAHVRYTPTGARWVSPQCGFNNCAFLGLSVQPVSAASSPSLPAETVARLAPVTPVRVLWDIDNDGRTDISCPGASPVIRMQLTPGVFTPKALIVNPDSEATGQFVQAGGRLIAPGGATFPALRFPNETLAKGEKGRFSVIHGQPVWCRNSIVPPPDPELGPCTNNATIGRVQVTGDMCPVNVRGIDDAELAALPDDVEQVVAKAAAAINALEREREKTLPGYSPGTRIASLTDPVLRQTGPSGAVAATAINASATNSGVDAARSYASGVTTKLERSVDSAVGKLPSTVISRSKSAFALDQIYIAKDKLRVNGVTLDPSGDLHTMLVPSDVGVAMPNVKAMSIVSKQAASSLGQLPLSAEPETFRSTLSDRIGSKDDVLKAGIDYTGPKFADLASKLDLGPFKLTGSDVQVTLNDDGTATVKAVASLPFLNLGGGRKAEFGITLSGDQSGKLKLQGLEISVPSAYLFGVRVQDLFLSYDNGELNARGQITFDFTGGDGIDIQSFRVDNKGEFRELTLALLLGAGKGVPVGPGIFITKFQGGFRQPEPFEIEAGGAVSVGPSAGGGCPTLGVDGKILVHLSPRPYFIKVGGEIQLVCIGLASVDAFFSENGNVDVKASIDLGIPDIATVRGTLGGAVRVEPSPAWQVGASGELDIILLPTVELKGVISNLGVAACGGFTIDVLLDEIEVKAGAGVTFPNGRPPLLLPELLANFRLFTGCDLGRYQPLQKFRTGRQADSPQTFVLDRKSAALSFEGAGAAPLVKLTSPSGKVLDFTDPAKGGLVEGGLGVVVEPEDRTAVILGRPERGTWTAEVAPGSPAILRIERAAVLPSPVVKATVAGKGARRVLRYRVKPLAGQVVQFVENGGGANKIIKTVRGGGRGKVRYTVDEARSSKRTIYAQVTQFDAPRERIAVERYVAPSPTVGRARVKVRRRGAGAVVTWSKVALAERYDVVASFADGRDELLPVEGRARRATIPAVGSMSGLVVRVIAHSPAGRTGRPGVGRLSEVKPKRKRGK